MNEEPLYIMFFSKELGFEIPVYNFGTKFRTQIIHEILELDLPNGNKHILLNELINR